MSTCLSIDDIRKDLRTASFGGVTFHVDTTSEEYGQRGVVHEFVNSDSHFTETLGKKARRYTINGYLTGKGWLAHRDRLISVCESGDPHTFSHPFYQAFQIAKCLNLNITESREELGVVRFSMEIVPDISIGIHFGSNFLQHFLMTELDRFIAASVNAFVGELGNIRLFDDSVRNAAQFGIQSWATAIDGARILTPLVVGGAVLSRHIENLHDNAPEIVDRKVDFSGALMPVVDSYRSAPESAALAADALEPLIWSGIDDRIPARARGSALRVREVEIATDKVMRRAVGGLWAEFVVSREYQGRAEATEARNQLVRWVEAERRIIDPVTEPEVYETFDRVAGRWVEGISERWADSAPTQIVTLPRQVGVLSMAQRLYNDPTRAEELITRNRLANPARLGPTFEAAVRT